MFGFVENNHIIDSIHPLSSSAEQVSGSSQEGMAVSNVILEQMQGFTLYIPEKIRYNELNQ